MKKVLFMLAVAALAFAACTKVENVKTNELNAISFQPATYVTKAVTGSVFPQDQTFGTYAWTEGTTGTYFMDNVEVKYDATLGVWAPTVAYYWPKNQSVDFFSYAPYGSNVPTVEKTKITYTGVNFSNDQIDFLYADKAVGYTDNANDVEDGQNAFNGVPTVFRHSGAKVTINVILGYDQATTGGVITKWDVVLKSLYLENLYVQGDCVLSLSDTVSNGIIPWNKPVKNIGTVDEPVNVNVWNPLNTLFNDPNGSLYKTDQYYDLYANQSKKVLGPIYVLPQILSATQQKVNFVFTVKTYRKAPTDTDFNLVLVQDNLTASATLYNAAVRAWEMNKSITYNIKIGPVSNPIYFDPTVIGWDNVTVDTNIELDI